MVSNDVEALDVGGSCEALLLTAKARVIAPLVVLRRGVDDFLLLTEDGLGERVRSTLLRSRFAAKCEIEVEEHTSSVVLGGERRHSDDGLRRARRGGARRGRRAHDRRRRARAPPHTRRDAALRARDRRPRPSCRGRARPARDRLREGVLSGPGADRAPALPRSREPDAAGPRRSTARSFPSTTPSSSSRARSSGASRAPHVTETASSPSATCASRFPRDAVLRLGSALGEAARLAVPAPVAQGIERCPAEAEAASSNLAGRIALTV